LVHDIRSEGHCGSWGVDEAGKSVLEQSADIDQLVIVGPTNPELVAEVVGPKARVILRDTNCSLLILRDR
jgi:hypothetical protein